MIPINRTYAPLQALVDELARCGLRRAVTCPGSRNAPLILTLAGDERIECTSVIDERSAGFMALGMAKASGEPVAITCTSGTAAANLLPAVAEAHEARVPLIVLTADRPPELREVGAGQAIDQIKLYGSAAKWFVEVGNHEPGRETAVHHRALGCRAWHTAAAGRPGPVHLNFPLREPLAPAAGGARRRRTGRAARTAAPGSSCASTPSAPHADDVHALAERAAAAPRGAIVCGPTAEDVAEPVARLAAQTGWPVLAEPTSGVRCGEHDRSAVVAHYDVLLRSERFAGEHAPDLVLRIGDTPTSKPLRAWLAAAPAGRARPPRRLARARPARPSSSSTPRRHRPATRSRRRSRCSTPRPTPPGSPRGATPTRSCRPRWTGRPIRSSRRPTRRSSPPCPTTRSSGSPRRCPCATWRPSSPSRPSRCASSPTAGANGIDGVVSSAAGAALASGRPTFLLTGELALLHDLGGLLAARRAGAELTIVCVNNGGGGIFDFLPVAEAAEPGAVRGAHRHAERRRPRAGRGSGGTAPHRGPDTRRGTRCGSRAGPDRGPHRPGRQRPPPPRAVRTGGRAVVVSRAGQAHDSGQQRLELDLGLRQLVGGHRVAHDSVARVQVGDPAAQQRGADRHEELAVLGEVGPADRARVPAAVEALEGGDQRLGGVPWLAAHRGRRMQQARRAPPPAPARASWARIGVARCCTFWTFTSCGLVGRGGPEAHRVERALDAPRHDRLLLALLGAARELLAQVVVDRGVGAAAGGPGQRHALGPRALAAHQQLRARSQEGQLRRADAEAVAGREHLAQAAEDRRRVERRGRVHPHLAGEHDLLELARSDPLHRRGPPPPRSGRAAAPRPRASAPPGRGRAAASARAPARRAGPARARPGPPAPRPRPPRRSPSGAPRRPAAPAPPRAARAAPARARPTRASLPPSGAKAKPPVSTGPAAAGRPGSAAGSSASVRRARFWTAQAASWKRSRPASLDHERLPQRRRARSRRGRAARGRRSGRSAGAPPAPPRSGRAQPAPGRSRWPWPSRRLRGQARRARSPGAPACRAPRERARRAIRLGRCGRSSP